MRSTLLRLSVKRQQALERLARHQRQRLDLELQALHTQREHQKAAAERIRAAKPGSDGANTPSKLQRLFRHHRQASRFDDFLIRQQEEILQVLLRAETLGVRIDSEIDRRRRIAEIFIAKQASAAAFNRALSRNGQELELEDLYAYH